MVESIAQLVLAAALFAAAPASGAQSAAPPRPPYWNVDHGQLYCVLARFNGADEVNFGLRVIPGVGRTELLVASRTWARMPLNNGQSVDLVLEPAGEPIRTQAYTSRMANGDRVILLPWLGSTFVDRFEQTTRLRLVRGNRTIVDLAYPIAESAVRALRRCFEQTLAEWGIDMAARASLQSMPTATSVPFDDGDYPSAALRENAQGVTIVRLTIGTNGRISDCAIIRSSGNETLDQRTCQVYRREGRFTPAIGADGQPAEVRFLSIVTWRIMG